MIDLYKAVRKPMKKKQVGPHRYTDPKGREWEWDPIQKKYIYIPKKETLKQGPLSDKDKRNQDILDDYAKGMSLKDLAEKYDLSHARIYGITRGKSGSTIKQSATKANQSSEYSSATPEAQEIADVVGVLPVGDKVLQYMKDNLKSIFKPSAKEANYLKGVNGGQPLGGMGAWAVDDDLIDNAIEALKECIAELDDKNSEYYKSVVNGPSNPTPESIKEDLSHYLKYLKNLVEDRKGLDKIHEVIGDDSKQNEWLDIIWSSVDLLLGTTITPKDIGMSRLKDSVLSENMENFIKDLGITKEVWRKRHWPTSHIYGVILASIFPDECEPLMRTWLERKSFTFKNSGTGKDETVYVGGSGNEYPLEERAGPLVILGSPKEDMEENDIARLTTSILPPEEEWTIEEFKKASQNLQKAYPEIFKFFKDNFEVDKDYIHEISALPDNLDRTSVWYRGPYVTVQTTLGDVITLNRNYYYSRWNDFGSFMMHSLIPKGDVYAGSVIGSFQSTLKSQINKMSDDVVSVGVEDEKRTHYIKDYEAWGLKIVKGMEKSLEKWNVYEPSHKGISGDQLYNPELIIQHIVDKSSNLLKDKIKVRTHGKGEGGVRPFNLDPSYSLSYYENPRIFDPVEITVSKSSSYGRLDLRSKNFQEGNFEAAKRAGLSEAYQSTFAVHGNLGGVPNSFIYSLGANYHARKMIKHYKGATKFVWPKGKPITWTAEDSGYEAYKEIVKSTKASMLTRQITRGKGKQGRPDVIFSDVPKEKFDEVVDMIHKSHDLVQHGGFNIKVNGVYKIKSHIEAEFQEAAKKYGNVKTGLYHGTSFMAGTPIMRDGYKIMKRKTSTGRRVLRSMGDGIYLADQSSKSAQYISGDFSRHGTHGVLFINDVAMGKVSEDQYDGSAATIFGSKATRWKNNEWAVRDPKAVIPRYWVDVESE
jgi:hypothetical protein